LELDSSKIKTPAGSLNRDRSDIGINAILLVPTLKFMASQTRTGGQLLSKVETCAGPAIERGRTIYVFDFASDISAPQMLNEFQELLIHKLK
jgi:hypothetical protein